MTIRPEDIPLIAEDLRKERKRKLYGPEWARVLEGALDAHRQTEERKREGSHRDRATATDRAEACCLGRVPL